HALIAREVDTHEACHQAVFLLLCGGLVPVRSLVAGSGLRAGRRRVAYPLSGTGVSSLSCVRACELALALLVTRIGADHHDPPMPTDHPALIANGLDAWVHLHGSGRSCSCSYL